MNMIDILAGVVIGAVLGLLYQLYSGKNVV